TALAGQQVVETLNREAEVREARAALHDEIATDAAIAIYSVDDSRCFAARLDAYDAWAHGGPRPPEHSPLLPGMRTSTWETVKTGAVTHMPLRERLALAAFYDGAAQQQGVIAGEREASLALSTIWARGELDRETAGRLLETVKRARIINGIR